MNGFREYLSTATKAAKSGDMGKDPMNDYCKLRVVIGNTSCDMDSAVGALVLAYYYTKVTGDLWTPVLNCRADEFFAKMEIVRHFKNCKIEESDLMFLDQL